MLSFETMRKGDVGLVSLPFDEFSSFLKGPARGPEEIRKWRDCGSMNMCCESGLDLATDGRLKDLGDIAPIAHPRDIIAPLSNLIDTGCKVLALGGDHSLSYGTIKAHASNYPGLTVLHLDAHPDLHDEFEGNRFSHACPFARVMEEDLVKRLVQVGIRTLTPHQSEQAEKFGVEIVHMKDWSPSIDLQLEGPVFLSFDIDVIDPAFAPGISHHEPGGITPREVIHFLSEQKMDLIGADLMEYNPERDINGVTGMLCVKLVKEIAGKMLS